MIRLRFAAVCSLAILAAWSTPARAQKSPDDELKTLLPRAGFDVSLFASEPLITNPAAIDIDTQGRVWVAEIQWYRKKAKTPPADSIKVLEDTNGDGKADKVTTFAEGVFAPMSICVAGDRVFVATSPDLWLYEDKNHDLKADGPPKKLLTGFGGNNHDHGAHSLVLGPDHKWWMSHGDTGFDVSGVDGSHIKFRWGGMLRGELDGSKLETVAVNFRNPYEICVSSFGEPFCSDNDNDGNQSTRICWLIEGGNYGWFGGPPPRQPAGTPFGEHWHFRGHIPGFVPATIVTGFGSPCGMCYYEADAFGPSFKNAALHCDPGPREVRIYRHTPAGFGMRGESEVLLTNKGDDYFRPDDVCTAPDGSLLVSDWYDGHVGGHGYNDPEHGRIFRLTPQGKQLARREKPGPYANIDDAIEGLKSPNLATQFLARERLLAEGQQSAAALRSLLNDPEPNFGARALWVLDRIGGDARGAVIEQLSNPQAAQRALAVRILRRRPAEHADAILALAGDPSPEVRREVLLAMRTLPADKVQNAWVAIAQTYQGTDRYELEALNIAAEEKKDALYKALESSGKLSLAQFPLLQLMNPQAASDLLAEKLSAPGLDDQAAGELIDMAGVSQSIEVAKSLLSFLGNDAAAPMARKLALAKVIVNLGGSWSSLAGDPQLVAVVRKLLEQPALRGDALAAAAKLGLRALGEPAIGIAEDHAVDPATRVEAIRAAVALRPEKMVERLHGLLNDGEPAVKKAALMALADLQDAKTIREILSDSQGPPERRAALTDRLLESTGGALILLKLFDTGSVVPDAKTAVLAKIAAHPDSNVRVLFERFIPEDQRPKRLGAEIKAEDILALSGDAARGEKIFMQSSAAQCKNCHVVRGVGGDLGPDLSLIGRKFERAALLETILDPSKAIAPEFVPYLLETSSGQVYAGFLIEKTDAEVVLKDIKSQLIRVPAAEVESLVEQKKSLMPDLVLRDVTAQDAADLLAYLTALRSNDQRITMFRVLGPFDAAKTPLDKPLDPEKNLSAPDLGAKYRGVAGAELHWELTPTDNALGFPAVDTVKYDRGRKLPDHGVAHYFFVAADSPVAQRVTMLLGADDGSKVWLNGQLVHLRETARAVAYGADQFTTWFKAGRNVIVVKVQNDRGPGGLTLGLRAEDPVTIKTE